MSFLYCIHHRNGKLQPEFGGRGSENFLKHDDIQFDKIFQDENCIAEGLP